MEQVPDTQVEPPDSRQRDPDTGQFVAAPDDAPVETEPQANAAPEGQDELADYRDLLDRYGSVPEALKALKHQGELIGRQGNELGELRRLREQFEQFQQQYQAQVQADEQYVDPGYLNELFERNPAQAVAEAIKAGNMPDSPIYERLMDAWIEEDPKAAKVDTQIRMRIMEQQFRDQLQKVQQPIQEQQVQSTWNQAFLAVAGKNPDMDTLAPKMGELARDPFFQNAVRQASSPQEYERIIEMMTLTARGSAYPHIQSAAAEAQRQAEDQASTQRQQAFVASGSSANREPTMTAADRQKAIVAQYANEFLSPGTR